MFPFRSLALRALLCLTAGTLWAGDGPSGADVHSAIDKLAAADNYSWTTTVESAQFRPGPSTGKTEKNGYTDMMISMRDNQMEVLMKNGKSVIKTDDGWQTLEEAGKDNGDGGFNPVRFLVFRLRTFKNPAAEADNLASKAKPLVKSDDAYSSDLTDEGAKSLLTFPKVGDEPPTFTNPKGSVKFWVKNGMLSKYQFRMTGVINFNGEDHDFDRTTTVEIKDVGATKVTPPDEGVKKLSAPKA